MASTKDSWCAQTCFAAAIFLAACGADEESAPAPAPVVETPPPAPEPPPRATVASWRRPSDHVPSGEICYEFGGAQWSEISPFEADERRARDAQDICRRTFDDCGGNYGGGDHMRLGVACEEGWTAACLLQTHIRYYYVDTPEMTRMYRLACDRDHGVWRHP